MRRERRCPAQCLPQWHSQTAVFRHEAPPLGHSSPGVQEACRSPQLTEQPPQLPRGEEAGALQEWPRGLPSAGGGPEAALLGGPVSLEGPPVFFALVAQPAQHSSTAVTVTGRSDQQREVERLLISVFLRG